MQHYHIRAKDRDRTTHGALVECWEDALTEAEIERTSKERRLVDIEPCTKGCYAKAR